MLLFLGSCTHDNQYKTLTKNISKDIGSFCLNNEGVGRLAVDKVGYSFSYQSIYDKEFAKWTLVFDFPLHPEEYLELDWSEGGKFKFKTSLERKVLTEAKVDPFLVESAFKGLRLFMQEVIRLQEQKQSPKLKWSYSDTYTLAFKLNSKQSGSLLQLNKKNFFEKLSFNVELRKSKFQLDLYIQSCSTREVM